VNDAPVVGMLDGVGNRNPDAGSRVGVNGEPVLPSADRRAVHELECDVLDSRPLSNVIYLNDVGVVQPGHSLGLHPKAGLLDRPGIGSADDHLEGNETVETPLPGLVDYTHATASQFLKNLVTGYRNS